VKKRIVMISLLILLMAGLFAANQAVLFARPQDTVRESMDTANALYEGEQFVEAAQAYEQLIDSGVSSSALFYNLGNAYYRQGDHGRAILNYLRAQQLDPTDHDIESNLALARSVAAVETESNSDVAAWQRFVLAGRRWLRLDEVAMVTLGLWMLFLILLVVLLGIGRDTAVRRFLRSTWIASAILLAVAVLTLGGFLHIHGTHSAVVVADEVAVRSGPGSQYVSEFQLQAGSEVERIETRGSWTRLALPEGELEGWVPSQDVEAVWE
jgi:tetratricopeptide (TPR) repeat protein